MADDLTKELILRISATNELMTSQLRAAERDIDSFVKKAEAANDNVGRAFKRGAVSAGQMRFAMRDLSMQIGDVATQFSLGARPMQIFASQGQQIAGAIGLMAGEATVLGRFLGGPWFQIITAATLVMAPFITSLFDTADAAKTAEDAAYGLRDALNDIANSKPAEALGKLNAELLAAEGRLRTAQAMPAVGRGGAIQRAIAIREAELAVSNARTDFNVAQLRARQVAAATAAEGRSGGGASRVSRARAGGAGASAFDRFLGGIESDTSADLSRAMQERISRINEANQDLYNDQIKLIRRNSDYEYEQREAVLEKLRDAETARLNFVASTYESLFRGGTRAIWDDFGQIGRRVISQVLAQFTLSRITGKGGFDLGSALTGAFTSVLGFADGGRPPLGRVSVVGERGPELFVPDVAGTIVPNHAIGGGGPSITINAPGATAETIVAIRREIANALPVIAAAATGQTTRALNRRTL